MPQRPIPEVVQDMLDHLRHFGVDNTIAVVANFVFTPGSSDKARSLQCLVGNENLVMDMITTLAVTMVRRDKKNFERLTDRFFSALEKEFDVSEPEPDIAPALVFDDGPQTISADVSDAIAAMRARCNPPT